MYRKAPWMSFPSPRSMRRWSSWITDGHNGGLNSSLPVTLKRRIGGLTCSQISPPVLLLPADCDLPQTYRKKTHPRRLIIAAHETVEAARRNIARNDYSAVDLRVVN